MRSSRRAGRRVAAIAAAVAVPLAAAGFLGSRAARQRRPGFPWLAGAPLLIAHRGGSALAPENTLLAFERALRWWHADILELDVQPTRDGEAVVFHDFTLERTTDGSGPVAAHELAALRELDAGYHFTPDAGASHPFRDQGLHIPTLLEVLASFPRARVNVEIKDGRAQVAVLRAIRESGAAGRVLIAGGERRNRALLTGLGMPVSASAEEMKLFAAQLRLGGRIVFPPAVDALQVPIYHRGQLVPTREFVAAAHTLNIPVHVWTVDEVAEMNLLLDNGVDGIITDRPDLLAAILHTRFGRPMASGGPEPRDARDGVASEESAAAGGSE